MAAGVGVGVADRFVLLAAGESATLAWGGWEVVVVGVARGDEDRVYVAQDMQRIILSTSAWRTLSFDGDALDQFLDDAIGLSGPFALADTSYWGAAVRAQARHAEEQGHPATADRLTDVTVRIERLLTEAASINGSGLTAQTFSIYTQRLAEAQSQADALALELRRVQSLLDTARAAVLEVVS